MTNRKFLSLLLALFMVFGTFIPSFAENDSVTVLPPRMAEKDKEPDNIVIMEDEKDTIPILNESEEGGTKEEELPNEQDVKDNAPLILEDRKEDNIVILPPIRNEKEEEKKEEEPQEETEKSEEPQEIKEEKKEVKVQILSKRDVKKPASEGEVNLVLLNDNPADVNEEVYDEKIRWKESDFKIEDDKIISLSDEGLLKAKINKKLVIPEMENITIIEKEAFKGLSLRSVEIPKNIKEIKDEAFKDNHLKLVKILGKGKEISKNAFNEELVEEYGKCEDEEFLYEYESTDEDELEIGDEIIGDAVGEGKTNVYVKDQYGNPIPKYRITTGRVMFRVECSSANPNECRGYSVVNHIDTQKDFFTDSNGYVSVTTPYLNGNPVPPPALDGVRDYFSKKDEGRTFSNIFIDGYRAKGVLFIENHDSPREPYNIERRYFPYVVYEYSPINLNLLYKAPWDDMKFFTYDGTKITGLSNAGIEYYSKNPHMRIPGINPEGDNITEIADKAFKKSSLPAEINLTEVSFYGANNIETIGYESFEGHKINEIYNPPDNLVSISPSAFLNNDLEEINLWGLSNLQSIGTNAFGNNKLKIAKIPLSVKPILGFSPFANNPGSNSDKQVYVFTPDKTNPNNIKDNQFHLINPVTTPDDVRAYTFSGTTITGLSEKGEKFYKDNHNMVLPGKNPQGQAITAIGESAFYNDGNGYGLTSVDFKNLASLKSIGESAFGRNQLTNINLSKCTSLISINGHAFMFNKLTSIDFSKCVNLKNIDDSAFYNNRLTNLDLSGCTNLTNIAGYAFNGNQLANLSLSGCTNLVSVGSSAFARNKLTGLDLSECKNLTSIGNNAFHNNQITNLDLSRCTNLVTISEGAFYENQLTNLDLSGCINLQTIGVVAFGGNQLKTAKIPLSLKTLADDAFYNNLGNNDKKQVYLYTPDYTNPNNLLDTDFHLINPITDSDDSTLYTFESTVITGLSERGKKYFKTHHDMVLPGKNPQGEPITAIGEEAFYNSGNGYGITNVDFSNCSSLKNIGNYAFYNNNIQNLDLSNNLELTTIGEAAFRKNQLTSLDLSKNTIIKNINLGAFSDNKINSINLSNCTNLDSIAPFAFKNNDIEELDLSTCSALTNIGSQAFADNNIKTSDIPLNVKKIGFTAFKNNPGNNEEKQVYLYTYNHANPNNLKDTDYHLINPIAGPDDVSLYEFSPDGEGLLGLTPKGIEYYKNHTHMVLPGISPEGVSVKYIDENAFSKEENIERLYYDDACVIKTLDLTNMKELTHIGGGVFFQNGIESIDFTGLTKLKIIDNEAFMRNNVTELDLSSLESLEELGHFVFGQNKLKTLNLNGLKNLKAIYDLAFGINKIEELDLSSCTSLKKIDLQAFFNNKINTVNIPLSVEEIGVDAFQFNPGNNTKQQVYLYTPDRTNPHNIKDTNTYLINPETRPDDFNLYTFEGTTITGLTERGKKYFKENPNIKLPGKNPQGESITAIADNAFSPEEYDENYPVFESVDFSNCSSLLAIGNGAFAGHYFDKLDLSPCTSLIAIGDSAFAFNEGSHGPEDKNIEVSFRGLKNLKTIGESAFAGPDIGNRVGKIDFSGCTGLETIGEGAFFWSRIDNLDLSSCTNLKTIKKMAFMSTDLKTLNLSGCKNLTTIEETAFHGNKLNSIDFSGCSNLQTIGSYAFAFSSLKTLDLSKCTSLKVIEKGAFYNGKINIAYIPLSLSTLADDAFQDNPGNNDKKQVYLYTPDYTNPNNLSDTDYHLINPITGSDDVSLYTFDGTTITGLSERGKKYFETHHDMKLPGKNPQGESITAIGKFGFTSRSTHVGFGLVSVDFSNCTSLTSIGYSAFGYNNLTSIDLSGCTNLKSIDDFAFERNQITSLDLSECTNLTNIGVSAFCENQITSLNVSGCTNLTSIGEATFAGNKLTSLDLSGCTNLRSIGKAAFQQNQIANLNLSGCTNLTNIANHAFYANQLTSLDLSECTSLKSIGIAAFYKNQLASLDLSTCTNLTSIGHHAFTYNKLTSLDLSGCISLKSIDKVAFAANKLKTSKIPLSLTTLADSTFQDNPGNNDKKQVYLYTPTRNNPMNLRDSEYHLVDPISFTIKKVDTKGNPMEGVEFAFYKLDRPTPPQNWTFPNPSTVVGVKPIFLTVTTDKNGKAEVTLPYSPYFLVENKTIPGYSINNTVTPIDATTEGKTIAYTDYEVSIEIPETGALGTLPYILLALILVGGAYVVLRKKEEEKQY